MGVGDSHVDVRPLENSAGSLAFGGAVDDDRNDAACIDIGSEVGDVFDAVLDDSDACRRVHEFLKPLGGGGDLVGFRCDDDPIDRAGLAGVGEKRWDSGKRSGWGFDDEFGERRAGANGYGVAWLSGEPGGKGSADGAWTDEGNGC